MSRISGEVVYRIRAEKTLGRVELRRHIRSERAGAWSRTMGDKLMNAHTPAFVKRIRVICMETIDLLELLQTGKSGGNERWCDD